MRLIATMGANTLKYEHKYDINNKSYDSQVSFMALAKAYNISDIIVIGTKQSEISIKSILDKNPNIEMVVIESSNVEDVFQKSLEYISKDTILDLTQGYRHYPMLTLLASIFLQNDESKNIKDIFYAQITDENCKPFERDCPYEFISLIKYLDIANMTRIINTFNKTLLTLDYTVQTDEFTEIKKGLEDLTKELFSNNFKGSKEKANALEQKVKYIIDKKTLDIIENHLILLKKELQQIQNLIRSKESLTLLNVSEYFLKKDILLHSVTLLYEAMVAFLDEKIKNNPNCKDEKDTYKRRNCLKKGLGDCRNNKNIIKCKEFSDLLRKIDDYRNKSAHAHTTGTYQADLKIELEKAIKTIKPILA